MQHPTPLLLAVVNEGQRKIYNGAKAIVLIAKCRLDSAV